MKAEMLRDFLMASAEQMGWDAMLVPEFVQTRFRGREDASCKPLESAYGLRLGDYPVIVAPVKLDTVEVMQATLHRLHSQMVIARSYMRADEVINSHLMLCAVNPPGEGMHDDATLVDWQGAVDLAQRDETVCRKIIWIPDVEALEVSYSRFRARTFLAMPWRAMATGPVLDATLDRNQGLVERMLVKHGLDGGSAKRWVELLDPPPQDADALVAALVSTEKEAL